MLLRAESTLTRADGQPGSTSTESAESSSAHPIHYTNYRNYQPTTAAAASAPSPVHQSLLHPLHGRLQQLLHQQQHPLPPTQAPARPLTARSGRARYGAHGRLCQTAGAAEAGGYSPRHHGAAEPLTDPGGNSSVISSIFTILRQRKLEHFGERASLESSNNQARSRAFTQVFLPTTTHSCH